MIDTAAISGPRFWQNWDAGDAAERIDRYWQGEEAGWREALAADIRQAFDGVAMPMEIVEIGSGSGLVYAAMKDIGMVAAATYRGGDTSERMLALARQRFPAVRFDRLDIFALDLGDASCDNVINVHVLQHLPHYEAAMDELLRVARCRLYVASWFDRGPQDLIELSPPSEQFAQQRFYNNRYSLQRFAAWLDARHGGRIERLRVQHFGGPIYSICLYLKAAP